MAHPVTKGSMLQCSFGSAPSIFDVLPIKQVSAQRLPAATIMDHIPMVNIKSFGMCRSPTNPMVMTATAGGTLTP